MALTKPISTVLNVSKDADIVAFLDEQEAIGMKRSVIIKNALRMYMHSINSSNNELSTATIDAVDKHEGLKEPIIEKLQEKKEEQLKGQSKVVNKTHTVNTGNGLKISPGLANAILNTK